MKYTAAYVVDRATWLHGGLFDIITNSVLLEPDTGLMCCLGQFCRQLRVPKAAIEEKASPEDLQETKWDARLARGGLLKANDNHHHGYSNSDFSQKAMAINDDIHLQNKTREKKLKALGVKHNIKITFVGRYAAPAKVREAWEAR